MKEFVEFRKIPRLNREIIVTEKIDGTNAQVSIRHASEDDFEVGIDTYVEVNDIQAYMRAGSRNRWLNQSSSGDNFGFAKWVSSHSEMLANLGFGDHYGEWWGVGIQRGYGLTEKRFSLFNTSRWSLDTVPYCCHVVPVLYQGPWVDWGASEYGDFAPDNALTTLRYGGSLAAPGFMKPEGIIVYHTAGNLYFKATCENDDTPKSIAK